MKVKMGLCHECFIAFATFKNILVVNLMRVVEMIVQMGFGNKTSLASNALEAFFARVNTIVSIKVVL